MNPRSPPTLGGPSPGYPHKRARHSPPEHGGPKATSPRGLENTKHQDITQQDVKLQDIEQQDVEPAPQTGGGKAGQSSSFRNVSACNRCRLRKNRCDQGLPSCASCEKVSVKCVGYDPITKREIPRR